MLNAKSPDSAVTQDESKSMTEINNKNDCSNENMLSLEQLRSLPGMENFSETELQSFAESLKEFSLILFEAVKANSDDLS
jgi:hypothetical protein